ncbi:MAG: TonB-dependent receptor [Bacteroidales bacterium]|nr:TonB-dependent receptor [Bacteroidales bacterium]
MKKYIFYLYIILSVFFFQNVLADGEETETTDKNKTDANIFGHVQCNDEHIPFVNILVKGTVIGTATDATGHYSLINLPEGVQTIRIQAIGYKPVEKEVELRKNKSIEVNFNIEEDNIGIEQVIITANRNLISKKDAPVIINTISPKLFQSTQSVCLAEGINFTPGLRIESNCQNCGFNQVRMNGLDGPYSQILINNRPVFSGLAGVYGLELIPANMIQRVEVVRGGGSALFGGNAIAGTINIITKDPVSNTFQVGSNIGITGINNSGNPAIDKTLNFNTSIVTSDYKSGIFFFGLKRNRDHFDANGDGFSELVMIKNNSVGFRAYYRTSDLSKVSFDFYTLNEFRRGGNKFEMLPHQSDITEQVKHNITGGGIVYELFTSTKRESKLSFYTSMQKVERESYYGAEQDLSAYGETNDLSFNTGVQFNTKFDKMIFSPSDLTIGIEDNGNNLEDNKKGYYDIEQEIQQPNTLITDQKTNTLGAYAQNQWDMGFVKLLVGLRFDKYSIINNKDEHEDINNSIIIPRTNLLFDITENIQMRLSYATGYRAPQIFDEDLHIETSGARRIIHKNAPDLIEETSQSISSSFDYNNKFGNTQFQFLAEGFYTKLKNPFANEYSDADENGNVTYLRVNAEDGATVVGTNFELNLAPSRYVYLQMGFTVQSSNFEKARPWGEDPNLTSRKILRSPGQYGYFVANWKVFKNFNTSLYGNYTGSMFTPHFGLNPNDTVLTTKERTEIIEQINSGYIIEGQELVKTIPFIDIGVKFSYDIKLANETNITISAGIKNIFNSYQNDFDKGINRDAGYVYGPTQPRTIVFSIKAGNFF